ncbi:MAG: metallophosphoesterase family protein [Bdellovibrionales bacterium]|nr:metallophosphoesterase family protein [Bdellovibrionales bacterium]
MSTICILSDTHDNTDVTKRAVEQIRDVAPSLVIHCGDFTTPDTLKLFSGLPLKAVFGNGDWDTQGLLEACSENGLDPIEHTQECTIEGKRLFFAHGDRPNVLLHAIASQSFDYIFHGHTHVHADYLEGHTRIINPGALYRAERYTFVMINLKTDIVELFEISQ